MYGRGNASFTGHQNKVTKQLNQKQVSILHLIFHHLTVVYVLFCSMKKGAYPEKLRVGFSHKFFLVLFNSSCVWIMPLSLINTTMPKLTELEGNINVTVMQFLS